MQPKVKFLLLGLCACVVLGALGIIWVVAQSSSGGTRANSDSGPAGVPGSILADGTIAPLDAETLPEYPGAVDVSHDKQHPEDQAALSFSADAPAADVLKFYSDYLFQNHWSVDPFSKVGIATRLVNETVTPPQTNAYLWRDRANRVPWTLALTLSVQEVGAAPATQSNVAMVLNRIPSLTNLPPYPDAEQVLYVTKPPITYEEVGDRRTTYVTRATPEQVLAFYQSVLPQCGWQADPGSVTSANVLHYTWSMKDLSFIAPDPLAVSNYYLAIKAVAGSDGDTNATSVTIDVNASHGERIDVFVTP
jgi:hypothetical protein